MERVLAEQGELGAFRTYQKQLAHRDRPLEEQLYGFMWNRKQRYAVLLVDALDLDRVPRPLDRVSPASDAGAAGATAKARFVPHVPSAFGEDAFGRRAEAAARFFGTPKYILGQTVGVVAGSRSTRRRRLSLDPYPFILLNLAFSTQAAYAAPLILLAQTRQADRDKDALDHLEAHREEVMTPHGAARSRDPQGDDRAEAPVEANTALTQEDKELTEKIEALTREIHARLSSA